MTNHVNEKENRQWRDKNPMQGIDKISWQAPNLADQNFMEAVSDFLDAVGPIKGAEFLQSLANGKHLEREQALRKLVDSLKDENKKLTEEVASANSEIESLQDEIKNHPDAIQGIEEIQYSAPNLLDSQLMEAFAEALQKVRPIDMIEYLKRFK